MKKYLLAAVAVLAIGAARAEIVGKSRLEIANDIRQECAEDAQWGIGPYNKLSTTQCVTARLKELEDAIEATRPCGYSAYYPGDPNWCRHGS